MKKFVSLALAALLIFCFAACGSDSEDAGTGKLEEVEGETIADTSALEPAANVDPSQLAIGQAISEEHTGDAWYLNGVRGESYIYFIAADNSSIGLAYVKVENGETVETLICGMTDDMHLVDEEAAEGESAIDIVFYDNFKAYDYKNSSWYVRGAPESIEQLFVGIQLVCQDNNSNTLLLKADGTGTEVFDGTEYPLTWELDSATTVKYNDGEHDYSLQIVTDESSAFVSLNEQNFRIFVPEGSELASSGISDAAADESAESTESPAQG